MRNIRIVAIVSLLISHARTTKTFKDFWPALKLTFWSVLAGLCVAGCGNKFLDPTQVGRFRPQPAVNVILPTLGVAEEALSPWAGADWEGAEDPRPVDVMALETDYALGSGDIVTVTIFELLQEGLFSAQNLTVTETGKISIPEVGIVEAASLTEAQLEEEIKKILDPGILKDPTVTVTLVASQRRTFSIIGDGVAAPARYLLPRYTFRLTDALATAGGSRQFNVSYIYVSRQISGNEGLADPKEVEFYKPEQKQAEPKQDILEILKPRTQRHLPGNSVVITSSEMITDKELAEAFGYGSQSNVNIDAAVGSGTRETIDESISEKGGRVEWIFQAGRWVPVQTGKPAPAVKIEQAAKPLEQKVPSDFAWDQIGTGGVQTRVIRIPVEKLLGGNPKYNIVIRPGDSIHVPVDMTGEFFVYGNVNRVGAIPMVGRPITLKHAVLSLAGGLGPLAWPKRCEVTRRLGKNSEGLWREETVMVDLDKIASGEQPDFFIKPLDLINVGTHPTSRWRAVLRNAFRATYGFGFLYDRNFADRDFGTSRPIPNFIADGLF